MTKRSSLGLAIPLFGSVLLGVLWPVLGQPSAVLIAQDQPKLREAYVLAATWEGSTAQGAPGSVLDPAGITVVGNAVYLVDRGNDRIQQFTASGGFVASWGQRGERLGDLRSPQDIAASGGSLFVTDRGNHRIVEYSLDGVPKTTFQAGDVAAPWGIAASADRVFVTYPEDGRVVVFRQGTEIGRWSLAEEPRGIDVGSDGRVYIADYGTSRILIASADGQLIAQLRPTLSPLDLAVDSQGDIYMLHERLDRPAEGVIIWYPAGSAVSAQAMYQTGLQGIALSEQHGIYATLASDARQLHGVVRYPLRPKEGTPTGPPWRLLGYPPGRLNGPRAIHYGLDGRLWVLDNWPRIQGFASDGTIEIQHLLPAQRAELSIPRQAVDALVMPGGTIMVGEPRYLHLLSPNGVLSASARLARGTEAFWLTALASGTTNRDVAVLDAAHAMVRHYTTITSTLALVDSWPLAGGETPAAWQLYWDLARAPNPDGDMLAAANRSGQRIEFYRRRQLVTSWQTEGRPARLAPSNDGSLFVLSTDGLIRKYSSSGEVVAAWDAGAYSAAGAAVLDLAVDGAGRVYTVDRAANTVRVWAPDPARTPEPPAAGGSACRIRGDKRAQPRSIRIGERVTVELEIGGECPNAAPQADILLAIDRSYSMNADQKITRTIEAALTFVQAADLQRDQIGLVTFSNSAHLAQPLTQDRAAIANALRSIQAIGGTNIADAIRVSAGELLGPRSRPNSLAVLVLLTDGKDREPEDALQAAADAKARGVRVFTIGFGEVDPMMLVLAASSPEHYYFTPDTSALTRIYDEIGRRILATVLARRMTIEDVLPTNMRYVPASAEPAATWEPGEHKLTWVLSDVPFAGGELRYAVEPLDLGVHPTNVEASANFVDGLDQPGRLLFPVPRIEVLAEAPTPTPTRTPFPTPTATPIPPKPLYFPIALAQHCEDLEVRADIVLAIDTSGSMEQTTAGSTMKKIDAAKAAASQFVSYLDLPRDQCAIVSFHETSQLEQPLSGDRDALLGTIARLRTAAGTRIDLGLASAIDELVGSRARQGHNRVIVLLTDGRSTGVEDPNALILRQVERARQAQILLFTIGLGSAPEVDFDILRRIASQPEYFYEAPTAEQLEAIYRTIAFTIRCYNLDWP